MTKHDSRILKFLSQGIDSDRGPTITDIMTKLNISISDISASLGQLVTEGLVYKKTNSLGLEMWFAMTPDPIGRESSQTIQSSNNSLFKMDPRSANIPPGAFLPSTVKVDHITNEKMVERNSSDAQTESMPIYRELEQENFREPVTSANSISRNNSLPKQNAPAPNPGFTPSIAKPGLSKSTFITGLAFAIIASSFISFLMVKTQIKSVSKSVASIPTSIKEPEAWKESQNKTLSKIMALEGEIKSLKRQLASRPSNTDSLKSSEITTGINAEEINDSNSATKVEPPPEDMAMGKGMKSKDVPAKPLSAKAKSAAKKEALLASKKEALALAKAKALQKKTSTAKTIKPTAISKNKSSTVPPKEKLAHGSSKKVKGLIGDSDPKSSSPKNAPATTSGSVYKPGSSTNSEEAMGETIPESSLPRVPSAPGLDNQDLPPPPE